MQNHLWGCSQLLSGYGCPLPLGTLCVLLNSAAIYNAGTQLPENVAADICRITWRIAQGLTFWKENLSERVQKTAHHNSHHYCHHHWIPILQPAPGNVYPFGCGVLQEMCVAWCDEATWEVLHFLLSKAAESHCLCASSPCPQWHLSDICSRPAH